MAKNLVYGQSGTGKTRWGLLKAQSYARQGLRTLWLLGDGGGETIRQSGLDGVIDVVEYAQYPRPFETTQMLLSGHELRDGKWVKRPMTNVGLVVIEGLTAMSDYLAGNIEGGLGWRAGRGELINNDAPSVIRDGGLKLGGTSRSHFMLVQARMLELVELSGSLPCEVLWTAHERRVEDQESREILFGPDVFGQKLTSRIGASFGHTTHLMAIPIRVPRKDKDVTGKAVEEVRVSYRAYLRRHLDPAGMTSVIYYANTRWPLAIKPDDQPEWIEPDPETLDRMLQIPDPQVAVLTAVTQAATQLR